MGSDDSAVTVNHVEDDDLDDVVELLMGYLRFYGREHDRREVAAFVAERHERSESLVLVARLHTGGRARTAGMVQVYPSFSTLSLAPSWILNDLYVLPDMRGRGVGRALLQAVRDRARDAGASQITLETEEDNSSARCLYESEGFEVDRGFLHYSLSLD